MKVSSRSNIDRCRKFWDKCRFQHRNKLRQGNAIECIDGFSICYTCHLLKREGNEVHVWGIFWKQFRDLPGVRIELRGVTKLWIADRGTYGTYIFFTFFKKKVSEEEAIFKTLKTMKNCDKIIFTNTEKKNINETDGVSTFKSRHYQVKNHSEGKMYNIN